MPKKSAGILAYRWKEKPYVEVFLAHPGGPYWAKKEYASWTLPKGEFEDEEPLDAAIREFKEETGHDIEGEFQPLPPKKISSSKVLYAFFIKAEIDHSSIKSNTFKMEWPPKSGNIQEFPEVDRAAWFPMKEALKRVAKGQIPILNEFIKILDLDLIEGTKNGSGLSSKYDK